MNVQTHTKQQQQPVSAPFEFLKPSCWLGAAALALGLTSGAPTVSAADVLKANNTDNLNLLTSWMGGATPTSTDVAVWDSTVTGANTVNLGASTNWYGLRIANPGGAVLILTNASQTLTLGGGGIDLSAATQDLSMTNPVTIAPNALQQWNVAAGRSLTLLGVPSKPGFGNTVNSGAVQFSTTGTIKLGAAASALIVDNQGNPWATYGPNDWAALDAAGNVIAAAYQNVSSGFANNVTMDADFSGSGPGCSSLRFNDPTPHVLTVTATSTATLRGILVTANSGGGAIVGNTAFVRPNRSNTSGASFDIFQNSAADFIIGAKFSDASSSTPVLVAKFGPGNLVLTNAGNTINGGLVINGGTVTLTPGSSVGTKTVTVNAGKYAVSSGNTLASSTVTFSSGTTNRVNVVAPNAQVFIGTNLTFNAGATRLEFSYNNGVSLSTSAAPLVTSNLTATSTVSIDIFNGSVTPGAYPLLKFTNTAPNFAAFALGFLPPRVTAQLSNDTANASIDLVVTAVNEPIRWASGSGVWDVGATPNWVDPSLAVTTYQQAGAYGDAVLFEDTVSGASPLTLTLNSLVSPASVTVSASKSYTFSGTGGIGGLGSLTKQGSGTLTLGTANAFGGGLNVYGGVLSFSGSSNLGAASGPISFGGGTLRYASGNTTDISTHTVTLAAGGGTIDDGGNTLNFANPIGNGGAGGLTKTGAGTLFLNGTNRYSGNTVVSQGTLALGSSTYISNSAAILIIAGAVLDASSSSLTLNGAVGQILAGSGTINGTVSTANGTVLSPGTNGVVGTLTFGNDLALNGGTYAYDVSTTAHDLLVVNGNLTLNAGTILTISAGTLTNGVYKLIQYAGALLSGAGSSGNLTIAGFSQAGKVAALSDATPGEIDLVIATQGGATKVWQGDGVQNLWDIETTANWTNSSGATATYVDGDFTFFNDSSPNTTVNLAATVHPGGVTLNGTQSYTLQTSAGGRLSGSGGLTNNSSGTLTVLTANNGSGPVVINAGTVQVGNGATSGDLGTGNILNNGILLFMQTDNRAVAGVISGTGSLTQQGAATLTLQQNNSYSGTTTINSGTLQVGTGGAAGSLGSGAVADSGMLVYNRSGSLTVGNIQAGPGGGGALSFAGPAVVTYNGGNTYQNNTYISNGVVRLSGNDLIPDANSVANSTGWLVLDGGLSAGVLDLNGFNETVNALAGLGGTATGMITNSGSAGTNTLTVLGGATTSYSGTLVDNPTGAKLALVVLGNSELRLNGANTYSAGTYVATGATIGVGPGGAIGTGGILMSNGATLLLHNAGSSSGNVNNAVTIPAGAAATFNSTQLGNTFTGTVIGGPTATNVIAGPFSCSSQNLQQYWPFSGTVQIIDGGSLRFAATSGLNNGGSNTTFEVDGTGVLQTRNAGTVTVGALTGNGNITNPQANSGTGNFVIGTKNTDCTFAGTITATNSIVKVGTGTLTLSGTLSYVGSTTVSNGVLALTSDTAMLDNSPTINLEGTGAVLDVSGHSDGSLNLGNLYAQTLNGFGILRGSLNEGANSTINVSVGTQMIVTNQATLNGMVNLWLARTNSPTASELVAHAFSVGAAAVLNVTNVGPNLVNGDSFRLFNGPVSGFGAVNLPPFDSTGTNVYTWNNNLAVDGTIQLASGGLIPVNTTPTNLTAMVSGSTLSLRWPADHTGWRLLVQTNHLNGISTNPLDWGVVAGSSGTNREDLAIDPAKPTEFYRLVYP